MRSWGSARRVLSTRLTELQDWQLHGVLRETLKVSRVPLTFAASSQLRSLSAGARGQRC